MNSDLWYRSRGLDTMEERFGKQKIVSFINKRLKTQKEVRILEIGFGEGKCLLDIRAKFPYKNVLLFGINNVKKGNMKARADFYRNSVDFGYNLPRERMPRPYFYDAGGGLKFEDNYFDLIISQVAIHYVPDKAKLIEEAWRTLKQGGKAFLHIDSAANENYPDFMKWNAETPRFIIYKGSKIKKLQRHINDISKKGYRITLTRQYNNPKNRILLIEKNNRKKLKLGLEFDGTSTLNITRLKNTDSYKSDAGVWWGTRSVYYSKR